MDFQVPENWSFNASGVNGLYEDKVHLTEGAVALNNAVVIEIVEQDETKQQIGGIYLPDEVVENCELVKGKIVSIGHNAAHINIKIGDIVFYDRYSAFYNPPIRPGVLIITNVENVIGIAE